MSIVYITGSSGFVGTHLIEELKHDFNNVVNLDRDQLKNLDLFTIQEGASLVHLAANVHKMEEMETGETFEIHKKINYELSKNLFLKFQKESITGKFIFISTVHVFGDRTKGVYRGNETRKPLTSYAKSKVMAEDELMDMANNLVFKGQLTILRLPMVYGPGNKGNILKLIKCANKKIPLPFKCFTRLRSMVFVKNVAFVICKILNRQKKLSATCYFVTDSDDQSSSSLYNGIFNTLNSRNGSYYVPLFILQLICKFFDLIESIFSRKLPLNSRVLSRLLDEFRFDGNLISEEIGCSLPYDFKNSISETIKFFTK